MSQVTMLFDDSFPVHYGFIFLSSLDPPSPDLMDARRGQANGLCGAAVPGVLSFVTGLHTGTVPFTIEWGDIEPALAPEWEDVVEVPFVAAGRDVTFSSFQDAAGFSLPAAGNIRARFCARGMDAAKAEDTRLDETTELDRYLLQLWPSPPMPEQVVRQTSQIAAYWHAAARQLPPPPSPAQLATAAKAAAAAEAAQRALAGERMERITWDGRPPSDRLRTLRGNVLGVARTDRDLLDDLAALDATTQRAAARWLARRAFERAGLDQLDWVRPALDAMDRGQPLPPPFTSVADVHALVLHRSVGQPPTPRRINRPSFAVPAIFSAIERDPLQAVVNAFSHTAATFESEKDTLVAALRERFIH